MLFTPLSRTIKNSGREESGREDTLWNAIRKWKRTINLKKPGFCEVFNCSNRAGRKKEEAITHFPSIVKNKSLKAIESEKGKVVSSNF